MDISKHNSIAWDKKVEEGTSSKTIERNKAGEWEITVTTEKPVPRNLFRNPWKG
ncbi:hypothetical protein J2S74_003747 [Evansella vedderi]|uniref:Uncharacterized protein n=1 Tax=Evansella vedderi TaxID=38282 RepID=A0ABT9ZYM0_9BACI|nr:hypothetical protein [Evansella vedderi]